ncbi:hypothetical protein KIN20_007717 [Parelaphostrongylus tenuis]|uniref:Uncharacterized protein n=1 Tax=Parelaphostrongylus tenuis TaxID=148309 RepID=A0AAD5QM75_PARTN|nr:hypothetical protein KIN20_007717 [Parelaphostrongylus tenuis]
MTSTVRGHLTSKKAIVLWCSTKMVRVVAHRWLSSQCECSLPHHVVPSEVEIYLDKEHR